jgi:NAD-reducing hydrogenase large subunit
LHYAQIFQSHALHFFYLASPDLLFGLDAPKEKRNVAAVVSENRDLAQKGILMRKYGQELIQSLAGKKIHGIAAIPGGVHKTFTSAERDRFRKGADIPSIETMIDWTKAVLDFMKQYHEANRSWMDDFATFPSGHLGLVGKNGSMELYHGNMRAIDAEGHITLPDVPDKKYRMYFAEDVEKWTYLKFPFLKGLGKEKGWNRVGPLARLNVCDSISTPLAEAERKTFFAFNPERPVNRTLYYHWARLIEMLHVAELMQDHLNNPEILGTELHTEGERQPEGIGIIEAPRGTLIHHYVVDEQGRIERCNLIVSTTHNNEAMNRAVRWTANNLIAGKKEIPEPLLNQVEIAIRAYDPCLSCATHAIGQMPLHVTLLDHNDQVLDVKIRS